MQTREAPSTVLHAEQRFTGKRLRLATSFQGELMQFCFTLTLLTLNALFATFGAVGTITPTRSTCSTNMVVTRWRNSSLYVVK